MLKCEKCGAQITSGSNAAVRNLAVGGVATLALGVAVAIFVLLPFINSREVARRTACINNIKKIGTAFNLYYTDNGGAIPSSAIRTHSKRWDKEEFCKFATRADDPKGKTVFQLLRPFIGNVDVMTCPSDSSSSSLKRTMSYYYKAAVDRAAVEGIGGKEGDFYYPDQQVTFWERNSWHSNRGASGVTDDAQINVLFFDGHVTIITVSDSGYTATENPPKPAPNSGKGEPAWFNTDGESNIHNVGHYYDSKKYKDTLPLH